VFTVKVGHSIVGETDNAKLLVLVHLNFVSMGLVKLTPDPLTFPHFSTLLVCLTFFRRDSGFVFVASSVFHKILISGQQHYRQSS